MDTIGIAVIVIAMIAGGMAIKIYQERRYFYLSTFFYKEPQSSNVLFLGKSGRYILNRTRVSEANQQPAKFIIDEGTFTVTADQLLLQSHDGLVITYDNVRNLVMNKNPHVHRQSPAVSDLKTIEMKNHRLIVAQQPLKRLGDHRAKSVVSVRKMLGQAEVG